MNLNKDRVLNQINCFQVKEKYTDTVLKFSDGHIYARWVILEAHTEVWGTLARDTNSDCIVEVILPDVSVAEGLVFIEEVYSNIDSLKILNPNSDYTVQNLQLVSVGNEACVPYVSLFLFLKDSIKYSNGLIYFTYL